MYPSNIFAWSRMRYCFDIDGTIFNTPTDQNGKPDYEKSTPIPFMRDQINLLYDNGLLLPRRTKNILGGTNSFKLMFNY